MYLSSHFKKTLLIVLKGDFEDLRSLPQIGGGKLSTSPSTHTDHQASTRRLPFNIEKGSSFSQYFLVADSAPK